MRRRGRRVVTPDGHVWFARRRRARRRPFWARRRPERFHGEDELPDPDEKIPLPGPMDLFTTRGRHLGELGFRRFTDDDREAAATAGWVILATVMAKSTLPPLTRSLSPYRSNPGWPMSSPRVLNRSNVGGRGIFSAGSSSSPWNRSGRRPDQNGRRLARRRRTNHT